MELIAMINNYEALLEEKARIEAAEKANRDALKALEEDIVNEMTENNCPSISLNGYNYNISIKTRWNKRSNADLEQSGIEFYSFLRDAGMGDLIKETVSPASLSSAVADVVAQHGGELPGFMENVFYDYQVKSISRRKATKKSV